MEELKEERKLKKFKDVGDCIDHQFKLKQELGVWLYKKDEEKQVRSLNKVRKTVNATKKRQTIEQIERKKHIDQLSYWDDKRERKRLIT